MTNHDRPAFGVELQRLGVAFGKPVEAETAVVYWDALADLEWRTVRTAMRDCAASMKWFPKPGDIRDAEFGVRSRDEQAQTKRLIASAPEAREYHCTACDDTGFVRGLDCPGDGRCHVGHCGQPGHVAYPHSFTRKCHCRATNPVLLKARETLRALAPKLPKDKHAHD